MFRQPEQEPQRAGADMRKTWIAAVACALSLGLAACGGSAPSGAADDAPAGCVGPDGTIKIGSLHPLSGAAAADGQQMANGGPPAAPATNEACRHQSLGRAPPVLP